MSVSLEGGKVGETAGQTLRVNKTLQLLGRVKLVLPACGLILRLDRLVNLANSRSSSKTLTYGQHNHIPLTHEAKSPVDP